MKAVSLFVLPVFAAVLSALFVAPSFRPDVTPPPVRLPENLPAADAVRALGRPQPGSSRSLALAAVAGLGLSTAAAAAALGAPPLAGAGLASVVALHPAVATAAASPAAARSLLVAALAWLVAALARLRPRAALALGLLAAAPLAFTSEPLPAGLLAASVLTAAAGWKCALPALLFALGWLPFAPLLADAPQAALAGSAAQRPLELLASLAPAAPAPWGLAVATPGRLLVGAAWALLLLVGAWSAAERDERLVLAGLLGAAFSAALSGALPAVACAVAAAATGTGRLLAPTARRPVRRAALAVALLVAAATYPAAREAASVRRDAAAHWAGVAGPGVAATDERSAAALRARWVQAILAEAPESRTEDAAEGRGSTLPGLDAAPGSLGGLEVEAARALALVGHPERGLERLERSGVVSASQEARATVVDLLVRAGRFAEALARARRLEGAAGRCREGLLQVLLAVRPEADRAKGGSASRDERFVAAEAAFARALDLDPNHARTYMERARLRLLQGRFVEAVRDFEKAQRLRPGAPEPHLELAQVYFAQGEVEAGRRELREAEERSVPGDPEVERVRAFLLAAQGDVAGALERARALEGRRHRLRGGSSALGDLYAAIAEQAERAGLDVEAAACARRALELAPDRDGGRTALLARVLVRLRRFAEAARRLDRAAEQGLPIPDLDTSRLRAWKDEGYARLLRGERCGAFEAFLAAVNIDPGAPDLGAVPALLEELAGDCAEEPERLVAPARRAFERARNLEAEGDLDGAVRALRVSLALLPANPYARFFLARMLERRGEDAAALLEAKRALEAARALGERDLAERIDAYLAGRGNG